jgi:hypothetical protein
MIRLYLNFTYSYTHKHANANCVFRSASGHEDRTSLCVLTAEICKSGILDFEMVCVLKDTGDSCEHQVYYDQCCGIREKVLYLHRMP